MEPQIRPPTTMLPLTPQAPANALDRLLRALGEGTDLAYAHVGADSTLPPDEKGHERDGPLLPEKDMKKKGILIVLGIVMLLAAAVAAMWKLNQQEQVARAGRPAWTSAPTEKRTPTVAPESKKPVPAFQIAPTAASLGATLDPAMFTGSAQTAYKIAKEIPETLAEVPCYCDCDRGFGHKSLHSCFKDDHGANCSTCINEAIAAYKMKKETKMSGREIRDAIVKQYGR
jgi:hypothetical protein